MQCVPIAECVAAEPRVSLSTVLTEVEQMSAGCLERVGAFVTGERASELDPYVRDRMDTLKEAIMRVMAQTLAAELFLALKAENAR